MKLKKAELLKVDPQCCGVTPRVWQCGGVVYIKFSEVIAAGIVASPKKARSFAQALVDTAKEAEEEEQNCDASKENTGGIL